MTTTSKSPCLQKEYAALGKAFVDVTKEVLELDSPPRHIQPSAKKILSRAGKQASFSQKKIQKTIPSIRKYRGDIAKRFPGRKKGTNVLPDADLIQLLANVTHDSCKISGRTGGVLKTLASNKRHVHRSSQPLRNSFTYRHFCRRLRLARLGIGVGSRRVDVCEICAAWDNHAKVQINGLLNSVEGTINNLMPTYFDVWEEQKERYGWLEPTYMREENAEYITEFVDYIQNHSVKLPWDGVLFENKQGRELVGGILFYFT